jgi:DNA recombination protein RmuC
MSGAPLELFLLSLTVVVSCVCAVFSALCLLRTRTQVSTLTEQAAGRILRSETDIVRAAVSDEARGLRQELGRTLSGFQEITLRAFGALRDGIDVQIRGFGERLDHGVKATADSAISTKLTIDMEQMRAEANTGRENLRNLIEKKLWRCS